MCIRSEIKDKLNQNGLRATPQRISILEMIWRMRNHPTADQVHKSVLQEHPEISLATVYNTLEALVGHGLVRKVTTDADTMRYDPVMDPHHHLYCFESDRIEDYEDPKLQKMLESYFQEHHIPGFRIGDIRLQIIGEFLSPGKETIDKHHR